MGKTAHAVSPGPFDRLEIRHIATQFETDPGALGALEDFAAIILDTSTTDRAGGLWSTLSALPSLVIDHHSSREDFGQLQYVDPSAPSTTFLVQLLIEEMGFPPLQDEADLLLLGFCTDTGFFRHLQATAPEALAAIGRLTAAGASLKEAYKQMFGGVNLAERQLLGRILARAEEYCAEQLLFVYQTLEEKQALEPLSLKTEEVYRLLQMISQVKILIFMKQEAEDIFSVSFRSSGIPRVDLLAGELGGGGHQAAAGCELKGEFSPLKERLLDLSESYLKNPKP